MFTRQEASHLKGEFWTTFGRYMSPIPSAEGKKINWVNFHTGVKDIYFRMDAGHQSAAIRISLEHQDLDIQEICYVQFLEFHDILHEVLGEPWQWELHVRVEDRVISQISKALPDTSVLNKDRWADLISFFKPRIIALDSFWENAKYKFEALR